MAAILRSGSFLRIFSGFRHSLATNAPRYEAVTIQRLQATQLHATITRSYAAQKPLESSAGGQGVAPGLDKALYRLDTDIRRSGRISRKDIEEIYGELKTLKYATSTQSLLLIRCCGNLVPEELPEVRTRLVQDIWNTLKKLNIPLDVSHYNALLRVYLENEHTFSPTEFLAMLEQGGVEPNRVTYQRLISRYCQEGDIDGAMKILEFMKEKNLPVSESIFNALIMGHSRANDLQSAREVLGVMQGAGLDPSAETYTALLVSLAEHGDMEGLAGVLQECEAQDVVLHDRDLMDVVFALTVKGHQDHAPQLIEKFQKTTGYHQDAINLIYRLLNAGQDEVAYRVFQTMNQPQTSDGSTPTVGTFFIKHLVKADLPVPKIVKYCQTFRQEGLNQYSIQRALEVALTLGKVDMALALLRVMREEGAMLRSHFFWPIFVHYAKLKQPEMVYSTVKDMITLEVPLTLETFRNYVIPAVVRDGDHEAVIHTLKDQGMNVPSAINSLVAYYLDLNDVATPANILSTYRTRVTPVMRKELAQAYVKTADAQATSIVLGQMVTVAQDNAAGEMEEEDGEGGEGRRKDQDVAGQFLLDVVYSGRQTTDLLLPLLQAMESRGISVSKSSVAGVQSRVGEGLSEDVVAALERLSAGGLTLQPITRENTGPLNQMDQERLEKRLKELEIKNAPAIQVMTQLLITYARNRDVEKAEQMKQRLDDEKYPHGTGVVVILMDMYVAVGRLAEAMNLLAELKTREPDLKLTPLKALRLAQLMVQEDKVEDAAEFLASHAPTDAVKRDDMVVGNACWRLLNGRAEKGDVATVTKLRDVLLNNGYFEVSAMVMGPVIKALLANDNLAGALEEFERVAKEYKITPWKHELTQRLINLEDTTGLQRIMDLSIEAHGEINSLYDLVFCFIECGRVRQARKILETPGLRARHNRLEQRCKKYLEDGKVTDLENLVAVTKDIFDVDRNMMFSYLLMAYERENNCDKALGIWTSMQEECVEPSDIFLKRLAKLLQKNGREVPFAVASEPVAAVKDVPENTPANEISPKGQYRKAIKQKDVPGAISWMKEAEASGQQLNIREKSDLIEALVQTKQPMEATMMTKVMLEAGLHPTLRVFRYLVNELSKAGEVDNIALLQPHITQEMKKMLSFDNKLCSAYLSAGRSDEYLDGLVKAIDAATDADIPELKEKFPRGGVIGYLEKKPDSIDKIKEIVNKYGAKGISGPANALWMYLFSEERYAEAEEVYSTYLKDGGEQLMFQKVTQKARDTHNSALAGKLVEVLSARHNTNSGSKGIAYSCWLDVLCNTSKYDEALGTLEAALKHLTLEDFNQSALMRLKAGLEVANKTFPYTIPQKARSDRKKDKSSSSSSSSSDSD